MESPTPEVSARFAPVLGVGRPIHPCAVAEPLPTDRHLVGSLHPAEDERDADGERDHEDGSHHSGTKTRDGPIE